MKTNHRYGICYGDELGRLLRCRYLVCFFLCATLSGCMTYEMTPEKVTVHRKFEKSVFIHTDVGAYGMYDLVGVRGAGVHSAIENSISKAGLFSCVIKTQDADYQLDICETRPSNYPVVFFNVALHLEWMWTLRDVKSNRVVWQETIRSRGEGNFGLNPVSWVGGMRLRWAMTQVVRENIKLGLERLSQQEI